jgi:hypothetical protein
MVCGAHPSIGRVDPDLVAVSRSPASSASVDERPDSADMSRL